MNQSFRAVTAAFVGWGVFFAAIRCLAAPEAAIVTGNRANLRSAPSLSSDLVGTLTKGQPLVVLAHVPVQNPQPEEPSSWVRVRLPASVKVWVYAAFIDPKSGTVLSKNLKVRSGPGRNFSEVGELDQGDLVSPLRTEEGWMQIEPPKEAVAYVAENLIQLTGTATPVAAIPLTPSAPLSNRQPDRSATAPPIPAGAVAPARTIPQSATLPPPVLAVPPPSSVAPTPRPTAALVTPPIQPPPAPSEAAPVRPAPPIFVPAPVVANPPPAVESPAIAPSPVAISSMVQNRQPELVYDDTRPRRVMREGVVKFSISPDAPGSYELDSFRRGEGTLDYLIVNDPKKADLGKWRGKRVFIEGDEYRDRRWRTPVLKVISVQAAY